MNHPGAEERPGGAPRAPGAGARADAAQAARLEIVGRFAAGIAHDFNNLLAAIQAAADAIASRAGTDAETRADAAQIGAAARRGTALVRHLLGFGRAAPDAPRLIDLRDALADLAPLLGHLLGRQVRLAIDTGARDLPVRIDPTRFDQVVVNLAANARDAMPEGGALAIIARAEAEALRPAAVIEVRDTGAGIPPQVLPHIFEPFFTTRQERGTGLGLATVFDIVREAGGTVGVDSRPGEGTCMTVRLPLGVRSAMTCDGGTVLLVEDQEAVRRLGARALTGAGWTVLAAASAEAALEMVGPEAGPAAPRLVAIVTDLDLPGLDGAGLVADLRARLNRPTLPALLVSGYAAEVLRRDTGVAAVLGASPATTRFLAKPFALHDLEALLREVVAAGRPAGPAGEAEAGA